MDDSLGLLLNSQLVVPQTEAAFLQEKPARYVSGGEQPQLPLFDGEFLPFDDLPADDFFAGMFA